MSSKVFVYNQADPVDNKVKDISEVTFGVLFDGTLNNHRNTEICKKVKGLDGYENPIQKEIDIYIAKLLIANISNSQPLNLSGTIDKLKNTLKTMKKTL